MCDFKKYENLGFHTKCIHAFQEPEEPNYPVTYPIYQTSNFYLRNVEHARKIMSEGSRFDHEKKGLYIYSRGANPTVRALEKLVACLEYTEDGVAFSSGMAAISASIMAFLKKGDTVFASDILYGETYSLLKNFLPKFGIRTLFVDMSDLENLKNAIATYGYPKVTFIETPGNPTLKVYPIRAISELVHEKNSIVVVDNTFATPYYQNPLKSGADIVVHSATKYLGGHSDVLGGVSVGSYDMMEKVRGVLYQMGGTLDPFAAWLILRGIKTLPLRMERHMENAVKIAKWIKLKGLKVYYPLLNDFEYRETVRGQMRGFSGIVSFDVGDLKKAEIVTNSVKLFTRAVSLGGVESLIEHPASMTHFMVPREERVKRGITDGLIRLSVGIEDVDDLINDLEGAFNKANLI
ncbi:MAG: trans-sulfuration enzyme family protein [Candidatus Njordarchaeia archaeon]